MRTAMVDVLASSDFLRVPILMEYGELKKLQSNASTDPLTGLYNRRLFEEYCEKELNRARRYGQHLALAILDLHQFKEVNDRYGHMQGDQVLQIAASTLRKTLRASDFAFRYGGDEFALLLPQADPEQAATLCRRIRTAYEGAVKSLKLDVPVSMDFGIFRPSAGWRAKRNSLETRGRAPAITRKILRARSSLALRLPSLAKRLLRGPLPFSNPFLRSFRSRANLSRRASESLSAPFPRKESLRAKPRCPASRLPPRKNLLRAPCPLPTKFPRLLWPRPSRANPNRPLRRPGSPAPANDANGNAFTQRHSRLRYPGRRHGQQRAGTRPELWWCGHPGGKSR